MNSDTGSRSESVKANEAPGRTMPNMRALVPYLAFVLIFAFFSIMAFDRFNTLHNFSTILQQATVLAIVAFGLYTAIVRRKPDMHWMSLMTALCIGAVASALPFVAAEALAGDTILPDRQGWLIIAYAVILPSLLAQAFYVRAVELIGSNRAGIFINFLPVWGALLSLVILGEAFHVYHAVALSLVVAGVLLAEISGHRAESRRQAVPS